MSLIDNAAQDIGEDQKNSSSGRRRSSRIKERKTPSSQPNSIPAPQASNSSSNSSLCSRSSADSTFDSVVKGPETPPTPSTPENMHSKEKKSQIPRKGTPRQFLFQENTLNGKISRPTSALQTSSPSSAASQPGIEPSKYPALQDVDLLSSELEHLTLKDTDPPYSPTLSTRAVIRSALESKSDYFTPMGNEGKLDNKGKDKDVSLSRPSEGTGNISDPIPSASETSTFKSLPGPNVGKRKQSSNNKKQCPSPQGLRAGKSASLVPQKDHKRSTSMHIPGDKRSEPVLNTVAAIAPTSTRSSGSASTSARSHKPRRRSTGSLDVPVGTPLSNLQSAIEGDKGPRPKSASAELSNGSGQSQNKQPVYPDLEHYHEHKETLKSLKPIILDAIRGKILSKYARLQAVRRDLDNSWKAWTNPSSKTSKTPTVEDEGYIYIFRSKPDAFPGRRYVKIGKTKQPIEKRRTQWTGKCHFEFIHVKDSNDKRFLHYHAVERIIHTELYNERRKYKCNNCTHFHQLEVGQASVQSTPTEHGEWFEISEERALQVVNKWREWVIKNEPYRHDGTLRAAWLWKCSLGSFWMNGTEEDWVLWREFNSSQSLKCILHYFRKWLGDISPLVMDLLMMRGAIFGLALVWYFWAWGFNFWTWVVLLTAVSVLVYLCFTSY
ncbi:T5orf172 domain containing protein [Hyaloscypha variabilis]